MSHYYEDRYPNESVPFKECLGCHCLVHPDAMLKHSKTCDVSLDIAAEDADMEQTGNMHVLSDELQNTADQLFKYFDKYVRAGGSLYIPPGKATDLKKVIDAIASKELI